MTEEEETVELQLALLEVAVEFVGVAMTPAVREHFLSKLVSRYLIRAQLGVGTGPADTED
jgi:hypothetical protein